MGIVIIAIVIAALIYGFSRAASRRGPAMYNSVPGPYRTTVYEPPVIVEPVYPMENPLVDIAAMTAADLAARAIEDSFAPPMQDPGFGNYDNGPGYDNGPDQSNFGDNNFGGNDFGGQDFGGGNDFSGGFDNSDGF